MKIDIDNKKKKEHHADRFPKCRVVKEEKGGQTALCEAWMQEKPELTHLRKQKNKSGFVLSNTEGLHTVTTEVHLRCTKIFTHHGQTFRTNFKYEYKQPSMGSWKSSLGFYLEDVADLNLGKKRFFTSLC